MTAGRATRWIGPALCAAAFAALLAWTWNAWADVLIDFGRELYVPWQMWRGKALYTELAYFNGPLSPALNATLFRLVGVGLRTLVLANLAIAALLALMLGRLLRLLGDRLTATVGVLAFLVFFAFEAMPGGNYNFVAPYSHEMTHGSTLAVGALLLLAVHLRGGGPATVFATGVATGLVGLTKAEFTLALVPAIVAGLAIHHGLRRTPPAEAARVAASFAAGVLVPPGLAFALLLTSVPPGDAWRGVLGSWRYVFDPDLRALKFYREVAGTLEAGRSLERIAGWTLRYGLVLLPATVAALTLPRSARTNRLAAGLLAAGAAAVVLLARRRAEWEFVAAPFPLIVGAALVAACVALVRRPRHHPAYGRHVLAVACLLYALLLLLKMFLNVRLLHYGFALAMPAGLAVVTVLVGAIPAWLDGRGRNGTVFRAAALGALAGFAVVHVTATHAWLQRRTVPVGRGADRLLADRTDAAFVDLLARVERLRTPGDTLAVIPEGVMLNYLARIENPTPFVNFMPPEFLMFTEERMLAAFEARPPSLIVLVNRGASEYGFRFVGDDYGRRLLAWVESRYVVVERLSTADASGAPQAFAAILRDRRRPPGGAQ